MSWYRSLGKKLDKARHIGGKIAHTVSSIGRKGGAIINKVADATSLVPGLAGASPVLHAIGNTAQSVGNIAHSVEGAIDAKDIKSAVAHGGMAYAQGKQLRKDLEKIRK